MNGLVSHSEDFEPTLRGIRSCWRIWWQLRLLHTGRGGNKLLDLKVQLTEFADGLHVHVTGAKTSPNIFT